MTTPRATYRLQVRPGFTFRDAAGLAGYLADLGVSHAYLSPSLRSAPDSPHGYDVVDPAVVDVQRGGRQGLVDLAATLREQGLGIVLDVVPNHVGLVTPHNPWWWDVLLRGRDSRYADHFDIDWDGGGGRIVLPHLDSDLLTEVVERRDLRVAYVDEDETSTDGSIEPPHAHGFRLVYHEHVWPLREGSLREAGLPEDDPAAVCAAIAEDRSRLLPVVVRQHYRLTGWREANRELNYRRFFDVTTLGGVRIEDPDVFADAHERILELVRDGVVDGLRIDHPDGIRDPVGYAEMLREQAGDVWIVFEKILEEAERRRDDWPIDGLVGYEVLNLILGLFVDTHAEAAMADLWATVSGDRRSYDQIVDEAKRAAVDDLFAAEVRRLVDRFAAAADEAGVVATRDDLDTVLREALVVHGVYRTYVRADVAAVHDEDRRVIDTAVARVRARHPDLEDAIGLLSDLLTLEYRGRAALDFVMRFQQLTGPVMAKGVEDTALYRFLRFVALNEVGGDPRRFGVGLGTFHDLNVRRQRDWPATMVTTSTHDTKRSEDVRARLAVLSELPDTWVRTVTEWRDLARAYQGSRGPSPEHAYLTFQTIVGAWPIGEERLVAYLVKAAREGKQHTSWLRPDPGYEDDLARFARGLLGDADFRASLERLLERVLEPGWLTSLSQTLLRLTVPGVPDTYQGTELWDLSLVDPDNRRPVDFAERRRMLAELTTGLTPAEILPRMPEGLPKLWVVRQALHLRRADPAAFGRDATYQPCQAVGRRAEHVVAFVRTGRVAVVVPRLVIGLGGDFVSWDWDDTRLELPDGRWHDVLTGQRLDGGSSALADVLATFPVALLRREDAG